MQPYRLDQLALFIRGVSFPKELGSTDSSEGSIALLRSNNIDKDGANLEKILFVPSRQVKSTQYLLPNDILICMNSGSKDQVGKSMQITKELISQPLTFGSFCGVLRCRENVNPKYIGFFFKSDIYKAYIKSRLSGVLINNLKPCDIETLQITIPSLEEQHRIANLLEEIDDLRQKQRKAIELTKQMIPALFYEMFGNLTENTMNWGFVPLQRAITSIAYGCSKKASEEPRGLPMIRMNNVTYEGILDLRDLKYVIPNEAELKKFSLKKGDILFNRTNSRDLVGKTTVWDQDIPSIFASYFIRIQLDQAILLPFYLSVYMNLPFMKQYLKELARGAIGQANINAKELSNIQVMIPPIELQKTFTQKAQECLSLLENQNQSLQKLDDLFNSSLHQVFSIE